MDGRKWNDLFYYNMDVSLLLREAHIKLHERRAASVPIRQFVDINRLPVMQIASNIDSL